MFDIKLTHIQTAVKLRPHQSHRLKRRKQLTGMKYWSVIEKKVIKRQVEETINIV